MTDIIIKSVDDKASMKIEEVHAWYIVDALDYYWAHGHKDVHGGLSSARNTAEGLRAILWKE